MKKVSTSLAQIGRLLAFASIALFTLPDILCLGQGKADAVTVPGAQHTPSLTFDVASVRESDPAGPYSQRLSNPSRAGTFDAVDLYASQLIAEAFGVNFRYQLSGGPDWLGQQRFVVHARSDSSMDARLASLSLEDAKLQKQKMIRALLADRFGFQGHVVVVTGSVYFLSVAKASPHLREAEGGETADPGFGIWTSGSPTSLDMKGRGATMKQLAGLMSYYLESEVIDQTGLPKTYDFEVRFNARPDLTSNTPDDAVPAEAAFPEQIGLKLVRGKGPFKMVIIDSLTKPSAN